MKTLIFVSIFFSGLMASANVGETVCYGKTWKGKTLSMSMESAGADGADDGIGTQTIYVYIDDVLITHYVNENIANVFVDYKTLVLNTKQATNYRGKLSVIFPEQDPEANNLSVYVDLKVKSIVHLGYVSNIKNFEMTCPR